MTLFQSKTFQNAPRKNYSIVKLLSDMEMKCVDTQKQFQRAKCWKKGSIVECHMNGEWDVTKERNITYILQNHEYMLVQELVK